MQIDKTPIIFSWTKTNQEEEREKLKRRKKYCHHLTTNKLLTHVAPDEKKVKMTRDTSTDI